MSRKFYIIITVVLALIFAGLVGYYFLVRTNSNSTTGGTVGSIFNFFPFGNGGTTGGTGTPPPPPGTPPTQPNPLNSPLQKLREISSEPVTGAGTLDVKIGTSTKSNQLGTVVNYIEKATGHIFTANLFDTTQVRISNTTIPLSYDAIWGNSNTSFIARYLKTDDQTVDTYSLMLKAGAPVKGATTTPEDSISATVFPAGIMDVQVLDSSVFYLQKTPTGGSTGFVSNFSGTTKKQIWNSPIRDLNSQYVNSTTIALTTKPAQSLGGYLYFVNTTSGNVRKILSNIAGLSTLTSPNTSRVLYLVNDTGAQMYLYTVSTLGAVAVTPTTFPEKCVWSLKNPDTVYCAVPEGQLDGSSLTSWYQGLVSFSDDIWKYDMKNNTATIIENLSANANESIDVIKPILSADEQYLVFMNKTDNSLWSLDLTK